MGDIVVLAVGMDALGNDHIGAVGGGEEKRARGGVGGKRTDLNQEGSLAADPASDAMVPRNVTKELVRC